MASQYQNVEYLNAAGLIRSGDYTPGHGGQLGPITRFDQHGNIVEATPGVGLAADFTQTFRYANGAIKSYTVKSADGSFTELSFEDPAVTAEAPVIARFGENDGQFHCRLIKSVYQSPFDLPDGQTPYRLTQTFDQNHLTRYELKSLYSNTALTGTYDVSSKASTLKLETAAGVFTSKPGFGQIDALNSLSAAKLISNDGGGIQVLGGGDFKLISNDGGGLVAQGGGNWSVLSNDGGTFKLISNDGGGLNQLDIFKLISNDGGGLVASGGGNLVASGGGNLEDLNARVMLARSAAEMFNVSRNAIVDKPIGDVSVEDVRTSQADLAAYFGSGQQTMKTLLFKGETATVDLAVTGASINRSSASIGDTALIQWTIENVGDGVTDPSTTQIWLSTDQTLSSDDRVIGSLEQGYIRNDGGNAYGYLQYPLTSGVTPGQYYVFVVANGDGRIAENGANNKSVPLSLLVKPASSNPDLKASYISVNKQEAAAGDTVQIVYEIKEAAFVNAGASNTRVYISSDANITGSDLLLRTSSDGAGAIPQGPIMAGNAVSETLTYKLPDTLAPGKWYIGVIADYDGQVDESREDNNVSAPIAIQIGRKPGPDLSIQNFTTSQTTIEQGGAFQTSYDLINTGTTDSGSSKTKIYLSTDATITRDDTLLTFQDDFYGVEAGGIRQTKSLYTALSTAIGPGTYYVGALADTGDAVTETSETNNASNVVTITVAAGQPDLDFYENKLNLSASTIAAGGSANASFTVLNSKGKGTAPASKAGLYLSTDATVTTGDTLIAAYDIQSLLTTSGQNAAFKSGAFTLSETLAPGTYYLGVIADHDGKVTERNEANNTTAAVRITVTEREDPAAPTIALDAISYDNLVNRFEVNAGLRVTGRTTGVEDGRTVKVVLKTATGATLGSINAVVQDDGFVIKMPATALPAALTAASLSVTADVSNAAGIAADTASKAVTYDGKPPTLTVEKQSVTITDSGFKVSLSGTTEKGAHVVVLDDNYPLAIARADAKGGWSAAGTLAPSKNAVKVLGYDAAGNAIDTGVALTTTSANTVRTGASDDTIVGNAKANGIAGGFGDDILTGGLGKDTFVFDTKLGTGNVDHIKDFKPVDDTIILENAVFGALRPGGLHPFNDFAVVSFKTAAVASTANIIFNKSNGELYYDPNGGDARGRVLFADLDNYKSLVDAHGDVSLTYKDFLVI